MANIKEIRREKAIAHTDRVSRKYRKEIADSIRETVIYGGPDGMPQGVPRTEPQERQIVFANTDTVSALLSHHEGRTAVLNFASYKNPGGGFMNGSMAQEEALCHESTLYNVLSTFGDYYSWNKAYNNHSLYEDRMLYSPGIVFERGENAVKADVITCAAPNASAYSGRREDNKNVLMARAGFIKAAAEAHGVDTIILGAYGCGVFGQDPREVAAAFLGVFADTSIKKVVYAVPGTDENARVFREFFSK